MPEYNPYQAPTADLGVIEVGNAGARASRLTRLGAVLLDSLVLLLAVVPYVLVTLKAIRGEGLLQSTQGVATFFGAMMVALAVLGWTIYLVARHGQTMGKRMLRIRVERPDGTVASLWRIFLLRNCVIGALGAIPFVGWTISVVDGLMIFAHDQRCLHDRIADTVVMQVPLKQP